MVKEIKIENFKFEYEGKIIGLICETTENIILTLPTEKFEEIIKNE